MKSMKQKRIQKQEYDYLWIAKRLILLLENDLLIIGEPMLKVMHCDEKKCWLVKPTAVKKVKSAVKPVAVKKVKSPVKPVAVKKVTSAVKPVSVKKVKSAVKKVVRKPPHPEGCALQTTKKYLTRPSPPYPANECCGMVMTGNDGNEYTSMRNVKDICAWRLTREME